MGFRYALTDDQWERIKDSLPWRAGHVGAAARDDRLFVDAVLYRRVAQKQAIGRARGGLSTKIHTAVDALGNPDGVSPNARASSRSGRRSRLDKR